MAAGELGAKAAAGPLRKRDALTRASQLRVLTEHDLLLVLRQIGEMDEMKDLGRKVNSRLGGGARGILKGALKGDFKGRLVEHLRRKIEAGKVVVAAAPDSVYRSYFDAQTEPDSLFWFDGEGRFIVLGKFYEYLASLREKDQLQARKLFAALLAPSGLEGARAWPRGPLRPGD